MCCQRLEHELKEDVVVYPLYSKLETQLQKRIFRSGESSTRMIVVSTNVAETSITIPTIRYVVDAGKVKQSYHQASIGLQRHSIEWISQAAAN